MMSYKGNITECFKQASQDQQWTTKERSILGILAEEPRNMDVITQPCGTGRLYWIKGQSKYKFYVHANPHGYNIWRV